MQMQRQTTLTRWKGRLTPRAHTNRFFFLLMVVTRSHCSLSGANCKSDFSNDHSYSLKLDQGPAPFTILFSLFSCRAKNIIFKADRWFVWFSNHIHSQFIISIRLYCVLDFLKCFDRRQLLLLTVRLMVNVTPNFWRVVDLMN